MTFSFQPPNNPSIPASPAPAPAQTGFAIPGQATPAQALAQASAPAALNIEQAIAASMQGASQVADRHPELAPGGQFDLTIVDFRAQVDRQAGLGYYVDVQINAASGVNLPIGTLCTAKIRGFNHPNSIAFAIRDIRAFMRASLTKVDLRSAAPMFADSPDIATWNGFGIPPNWIGDDARWIQLISGVVKGKPIVGTRLFCKSAAKTGQVGKSKTVYEWFAAA